MARLEFSDDSVKVIFGFEDSYFGVRMVGESWDDDIRLNRDQVKLLAAHLNEFICMSDNDQAIHD